MGEHMHVHGYAVKVKCVVLFLGNKNIHEYKIRIHICHRMKNKVKL